MAVRSQLRLDLLPVELTRLVLGSLPSRSFLACRLVCRSLLSACDGWEVWKSVAVGGTSFASPPSPQLHKTPEVWKRYVILDSMAQESRPAQNMASWMPLAIILHRRLSFASPLE